MEGGRVFQNGLEQRQHENKAVVSAAGPHDDISSRGGSAEGNLGLVTIGYCWLPSAGTVQIINMELEGHETRHNLQVSTLNYSLENVLKFIFHFRTFLVACNTFTDVFPSFFTHA